uniref:Methylated-DNA--protein-cysteine methyltransferase n=1 Tax=Caenorhabditis japonica TaxID=281687 RepID=A0A8R1DNB8_CAEJA
MQITNCAYQLVDTNQGQVLIAECVTSSKVLAIYFVNGDLSDQMEELHSAYPTVSFVEGEPTQTQEIVRAINTLDCTVPISFLQKSSSTFAMNVYNFIRRIPKGETRSYSQVAAAIGNPDAFRAVAGACARNNLAYIVPCHRVIGSTGNLSGYRWGTDKKRQLLRAEGVELTFRAM